MISSDIERRAKLRNSKWHYWSFIPALPWASWLHIGVLTKEARYFVLAVLYAIPYFALMGFAEQLAPARKEPGDAFGVFLLAYYVGGIVHVLRERRKFNLRFSDAPFLHGRSGPAQGGNREPVWIAPEKEMPERTAPPSDAETVPPRPETRKADPTLRSFVFERKTGLAENQVESPRKIVPILPLKEAPDSSAEVETVWAAPAVLGRILRPLNFVFDRRFYSAISICGEDFYVTQTSQWLGLLPVIFAPPRRIHLARQHKRQDILKLVITSTPKRERSHVYNAIYESVDNRSTSDELFRLYVRGSGKTVVKYAFSIADDTGSSPISMEEAYGLLYELVPADRRSSVPFTAGRREKEMARLHQRMRNKAIVAAIWFALTGFFVFGLARQPFTNRTADEKRGAAIVFGVGALLFGGLGWHSLRGRSALKLQASELQAGAPGSG